MKYAFTVTKMNVNGHSFFEVVSVSLKGCVAQGDTYEEAIKLFEEVEDEWIVTAKKYGIPIPKERRFIVRPESTYKAVPKKRIGLNFLMRSKNHQHIHISPKYKRAACINKRIRDESSIKGKNNRKDIVKTKK